LGAKIRSAEDQANKKKKKGAETPVSNEPKKMLLYVADKFPKWQEDVIQVLKSTYNSETKFDGSERQKFKELGLDKDKRVMPFVAMIKVMTINSRKQWSKTGQRLSIAIWSILNWKRLSTTLTSSDAIWRS
jgi:hypothetical protein